MLIAPEVELTCERHSKGDKVRKYSHLVYHIPFASPPTKMHALNSEMPYRILAALNENLLVIRNTTPWMVYFPKIE